MQLRGHSILGCSILDNNIPVTHLWQFDDLLLSNQIIVHDIFDKQIVLVLWRPKNLIHYTICMYPPISCFPESTV
jgi:hypothetical protein